ncbi:MAG: 16S rRNA (cytosine(1402)-N(4))-methyltransferase RsmH [Candidatus Omnitrophica bacterium]|nr:16S rRNA (cytosine(1402)-N(4))-methyltransferase RsmH [Candidatus Omnitrophota bacterium]
MLQEALTYLNPQPEGIFVDGTLGLGGHSRAILQQIGPKGRLIGLDCDASAIEIAKKNLIDFNNQCLFIHSNYRDLCKQLQARQIKQIDGLLVDLGLSSFQIDDPERGFSLRSMGPLDMRMDQSEQFSAFDLIHSLSEKELDSILDNFGQERWHHRIARLLVAQRSKQPIETTQDLTRIVLSALPAKRNRQKIHPATRTFQAIRIAVNRELESLEALLKESEFLLKKGGRIAVISFHSLEDRIVKNVFRDWGKEGKYQVLLKKPLRPTEEEVKQNPRARSARLRAVERI